MTDTAGPTTLGSIRQGHDPRVPGLLAELEQLRSIAGTAAGVAQRALGMVDALVARLEHDEQQLEQLHGKLEQLPQLHADGDVPTLAQVAEHVGELEDRQNVLAKALVSSVPGAASAMRKALTGGS